MDPATILAIVKLASDLAVPLIAIFANRGSDGKPAIAIGIILKDTPARNAETLALIASANAEPPK